MITVNGFEVKPTIFPDKTSQVWKLPKEILQHRNFVNVEWTFENESELFHLAQLKHLLDHHNISTSLLLNYLPYGRQDKSVSNDSTFALLTFNRIINGMHFNEITINDPHSDVAIRGILRSKAIYPDLYVSTIFEKTKTDVLCYPDKGALNKYGKIFDQNYIYGEKVRDQSSGNITSYTLHGNPSEQNVLIVDDICDGGATFIYLAKALKIAGAKEVNLFVSHGLFTKGIQVLKDAGINRIFTTNGEVHT